MQTRSFYLTIPLSGKEVCFTYPSEAPGRFFEIDKYPDGTTLLWLGRLWAITSPRAASS